MIDISVITVTHESVGFVEELIMSVVSGALTSSVEHFVVDNGSTDGTVERVERYYSGYVTLIKNQENVGFGAANNRAYALAKGRYVLFLNPDMQVKEGSLDCLVEWLDAHPEAGIVSCRPVDVKGRLLRHRCPCDFPTWQRNVLWLVWPFMRLARREWDSEARGEVEVDAVLGAFMLVRREMLERLGFAFDPRYFLTFEDVDLCQEAKRLGYKVFYYPAVSCVDFNSRSFAKKQTLWIYLQVSKGMLTYFRKWSPWYAAMCIAVCIPLGYFVRYLTVKLRTGLKGY